jgi:hypothetical protein
VDMPLTFTLFLISKRMGFAVGYFDVLFPCDTESLRSYDGQIYLPNCRAVLMVSLKCLRKVVFSSFLYQITAITEQYESQQLFDTSLCILQLTRVA